MNILLTGATGYVGGRLLTRLLEAGHDVRVLVRSRKRVEDRPWFDRVSVFEGDLHHPESLAAPLEGVDAAYYMVHSMYAQEDFARLDREAATNFAKAAGKVPHVIYLGGLVPEGIIKSKHLHSRKEVGEILAASCPCTELRAGPIIGSGSASFEMVRYLTERLPVMVAPKWIHSKVQPIAIRDILTYLQAALDLPPSGAIDVGSEPLTFKQMMMGYAEVRGLKRRILGVPVFAPWLASRWVGLVTPIPNRLAVPLVQGVLQDLVGDLSRARELFPGVEPADYRLSVQRALETTESGNIETRWSGAHGENPTYEVSDREGVMREVRTVFVNAPPEKVFSACTGVGGERGYGKWDVLWEVRGMLDRVVGGPGLRRGRRDPDKLLTGEALDFWRVEEVKPPSSLRLRAEMKVPGEAFLQWECFSEKEGTRLVQTASFVPDGLPGVLYWYSTYPLHKPIFTDLVNGVARRAVAQP